MELGAFSISLNVKDIAASQEFYEKLGFEPIGGVAEQGWLILRSGTTTIGLFVGMIGSNTLTFNPGWDAAGQPLESFQDIREIQKHLKSEGVKLDTEADESTSGPASVILTDPDGNPVLLDQHV